MDAAAMQAAPLTVEPPQPQPVIPINLTAAKPAEKLKEITDRLDEARAAIPKKKALTKERTFDEAAGNGKTRLRFEEKEKPIPGGSQQHNPLSRPVQEVGVFVHNKIHSVEKDNSGLLYTSRCV